MLFIFKNQNKVSFFFLCLIIIICSLNIYFNPFLFVSIYKDAPLSNQINNLLFNTFNEQFLFILYCFITMVNALVFNKIALRLNFIEQKNYIPALIFVCLFAYFNEYLYYTPLFYINLILLLTIGLLSQSINKNITPRNISAIGFLHGLSLFFYVPCIVLVAFLLIGLILNKQASQFSLPNFGNQNTKSLQFGFACFISFIAFLFSKKESRQNPIKFYSRLILLLSILIVSITFFTIKSEMEVLTLLLVPLAIYLSKYLLNNRKSWLAEFLFILLFISIFAFQYIIF